MITKTKTIVADIEHAARLFDGCRAVLNNIMPDGSQCVHISAGRQASGAWHVVAIFDTDPPHPEMFNHLSTWPDWLSNGYDV